jgi:hypothetical protein
MKAFATFFASSYLITIQKAFLPESARHFTELFVNEKNMSKTTFWMNP